MVTVCLYGGHTGHVETKKMANKDGILVHYSLQEAIFNIEFHKFTDSFVFTTTYFSCRRHF